MIISSIIPVRAIVGVSVQVSIKGGPFVFSNEMTCVLQPSDPQVSALSSRLIWKSPFESVCVLPAGALPGMYRVGIAHSGVNIVFANASIDLINAPVVVGATPSRGTSGGNTTITLTGRHFSNDMSCCFDSSCVPLLVLNESSAKCWSSPHTTGMIPVTLYSDVVGHIATGITFEYLDVARIDALIPPLF